MSTQTVPHCANPFFTCKNTTPELKIKLCIQVKGENFEICETCWSEIAESKYEWETKKEENKNEMAAWSPKYDKMESTSESEEY